LYSTDKIPVTIIKFQWETPLLSLKIIADLLILVKNYLEIETLMMDLFIKIPFLPFTEL